jgi:hypothetical protein
MRICLFDFQVVEYLRADIVNPLFFVKNPTTARPPLLYTELQTAHKSQSETAKTLKSYCRKEQTFLKNGQDLRSRTEQENLKISVPDAQKSPKGMGK